MLTFQLIDHEGNSPSLDDVDRQICDLLGETYSKKYYCPIEAWYDRDGNYAAITWYDTVGLALAMGKTFNEIRETWQDCNTVLKVVDFLEANYTVKSAYQPK